MIKLIKFLNKNRIYDASYIQEVKTFNLLSKEMNDECIPYLDSTACMLWIDDKNVLCELESIYPVDVNEDRGFRKMQLEEISGLPVILVDNEDKVVKIFREGKDVILFLNDNKKPDKKCVNENIIYYISKNEIIAIECKNTEIV